MIQIIEVLQNFQKNNSLTQHDMAILLNISQTSYNNWINNKTQIEPKYYPKVALVCNVELASFIPPDASIQIFSRNFQNEFKVNALELYEKFTKNLEEQNQFLKEQILSITKQLKEKENELIEKEYILGELQKKHEV
jgi:transcriptional regulator with XRE-family HTH domain